MVYFRRYPVNFLPLHKQPQFSLHNGRRSSIQSMHDPTRDHHRYSFSSVNGDFMYIFLSVGVSMVLLLPSFIFSNGISMEISHVNSSATHWRTDDDGQCTSVSIYFTLFPVIQISKQICKNWVSDLHPLECGRPNSWIDSTRMSRIRSHLSMLALHLIRIIDYLFVCYLGFSEP